MTDEEIKRYAARLDDTNLCDRIETADGFIDEHGIDSYVGALAADYRVALEALTAARRERDEALANQRDTNNRLCIVEMALAAHRARTGQETNARIEAMRRRTEEALAQVAEAFEERDASYEARASAERSAAEAWAKYRADKAEMRAEAEQRGRAAERARVRAAVEQMMADAVHEVSDLRVMMRENGKTETTYADFTRDQGKIDALERVLQVLNAHVGAGKGGDVIVEACAECGCALRDSAGRPITTRNCATCERTRHMTERAARIESAARELLEALPRCRYDGLDVSQQCEARAMWVCFDLTCAPEFRCDAHKYEHAEIGGCFDHAESHPTWWAYAAAKLAAELEE